MNKYIYNNTIIITITIIITNNNNNNNYNYINNYNYNYNYNYYYYYYYYYYYIYKLCNGNGNSTVIPMEQMSICQIVKHWVEIVLLIRNKIFIKKRIYVEYEYFK